MKFASSAHQLTMLDSHASGQASMQHMALAVWQLKLPDDQVEGVIVTFDLLISRQGIHGLVPLSEGWVFGVIRDTEPPEDRQVCSKPLQRRRTRNISHAELPAGRVHSVSAHDGWGVNA